MVNNKFDLFEVRHIIVDNELFHYRLYRKKIKNHLIKYVVHQRLDLICPIQWSLKYCD